MGEMILHSGSFETTDGKNCSVWFYKENEVISHYPTVLRLPYYGETKQVTIWSRQGNVKIYTESSDLPNPTADWVTVTQASATKMPNSDYYSYVFDVTCEFNSGTNRETLLYYILDNGSSIDRMSIYQNKHPDYITSDDIEVNPTSLTFGSEEETYYLDIYCPYGDAKLFDITDSTSEWLSWKQVDAYQLHATDQSYDIYYHYTYEITCKENTNDLQRTSSLTVGVEGVSITQASKTISITQKGVITSNDIIISNSVTTELSESAGTTEIYIMSTEGQVYLAEDNLPDWMTIKSKTPMALEGTDYVLYTYVFAYTANPTVNERTINLTIGIEGIDLSQASKTKTYTQAGHTIVSSDIDVSDSSLYYYVPGGTKYISISCKYGNAKLNDLTDSSSEWLSWKQVSQSQIAGTDYYKYTYSITSNANTTTSARETTIPVGVEGSSAVKTVVVKQGKTVTADDIILSSTNLILSADQYAKNGYPETLTFTAGCEYGDVIVSDSADTWLGTPLDSKTTLIPYTPFYKKEILLTRKTNPTTKDRTTTFVISVNNNNGYASKTVTVTQKGQVISDYLKSIGSPTYNYEANTRVLSVTTYNHTINLISESLPDWMTYVSVSHSTTYDGTTTTYYYKFKFNYTLNDTSKLRTATIKFGVSEISTDPENGGWIETTVSQKATTNKTKWTVSPTELIFPNISGYKQTITVNNLSLVFGDDGCRNGNVIPHTISQSGTLLELVPSETYNGPSIINGDNSYYKMERTFWINENTTGVQQTGTITFGDSSYKTVTVPFVISAVVFYINWTGSSIDSVDVNGQTWYNTITCDAPPEYSTDILKNMLKCEVSKPEILTVELTLVKDFYVYKNRTNEEYCRWKYSVKFTMPANTTGEERSSTVTFSLDTLKESRTYTQNKE